MPAKYLEVFSVVYKDFFSGRYRSNEIENYIVNISESKDLYNIHPFFDLLQKEYILLHWY
jgi:hypothetical protein